MLQKYSLSNDSNVTKILKVIAGINQIYTLSEKVL